MKTQYQQSNTFSNQQIMKNSRQNSRTVVLTYIEAIPRELDCKMGNQKPQPLNNLTKAERTTLHKLSERVDIMITNAEKGGAAVIMDLKGKD